MVETCTGSLVGSDESRPDTARQRILPDKRTARTAPTRQHAGRAYERLQRRARLSLEFVFLIRRAIVEGLLFLHFQHPLERTQG